MYAEDAVLMPSHAAVATGHTARRAFLTTDTAAAKAAGVKLVPGTATAGIAGDTGWESGSYTIVDASGTTVDGGSYLAVSRKSNGKWLLVRDTYNSDRPLPAPAPAAAEKKSFRLDFRDLPQQIAPSQSVRRRPLLLDQLDAAIPGSSLLSVIGRHGGEHANTR
jgi:ketosteroid isomerase-like protein